MTWLALLALMLCGDAVDRLEMSKLKAVHEGIAELARQRQVVPRLDGWQDVRSALHVHSKLSHDSRAPIEEVVHGAKRAGVRVLMFNEHPARTHDYFRDGHRGMMDGVLLIPGAETGGFLAFPRRSIQEEKTKSNQEFALLVRRDDGLVFLSHLEERMDWKIDGITGVEIYNTHADAKDERRLFGLLRSPTGLLRLSAAVKAYPQETFGSLLDYPADYLKRYDQLCRLARHTGVAANDAHHNQGLIARWTAADELELADSLGAKQGKIDLSKQPLLKALTLGKKVGDVVFELQLDPYERSLGHVSTHLLIASISEAEVWGALKAGRAYVSFDWLGDPSDIRIQLVGANRSTRFDLGAEVAFVDGLFIEAQAPLPCQFRILKDGAILGASRGRECSWRLAGPGIYRVEAWLDVSGESKPWVLANPFYVRP